MTNNINGIDVSESVLTATNNDVYYSQNAVDELLNKIKRLQEENEKIKNCYACGNCNGKEDYINLEKHHKGLRKQFDEYVKRNYTLSLRTEELEKENEELKARLKILDDEVLTVEITLDEFEKIKKYKQALEEIREQYVHKIFYKCDKTEEECPCHNCIILGQLDRVQSIIKKIDEVLNDRN